MKVLGISKIVLPKSADAEPQGPLEVWDDCWESAMMFLRLGPADWVYAGMGSCVGINKQTLEWYMNVYAAENKHEMLDDLQIMERHAVKLMNKS
jgi:hypothetical protein